MATREERAAYIQQAAIARGIDPRTALRVVMGEGLNSNGVGDGGSSFGDWQLHYGGMNPAMPNAGLGDEFTARTGLDARNQDTWMQQTDFSLDWAKQHGWGDWMGAKAAGITGFDGITGGGQGTLPASTGGMVNTGAAGGTGKASEAGGYIEFGGDPAATLADALAMRDALDEGEAQPQSLLADAFSSSSVGSQSGAGGGGLSPTAADQNQEAVIPDFSSRAGPQVETAPDPSMASPVADSGGSLADLFEVKDIGKPNEIDPYTGQVKPFRSRRIYG